MQVDMVFHHPDSSPDSPDALLDFEVTRTLPALPRRGDTVLWTDEVQIDGTLTDRYREYVVQGVDWSTRPDSDTASIRIRLDFRSFA